MLSQCAADLMAGLTAQILLGRPGDERDASTLIALLDGLIFNIVVGQETAESATAILRAQLDRVFSPPPGP